MQDAKRRNRKSRRWARKDPPLALLVGVLVNAPEYEEPPLALLASAMKRLRQRASNNAKDGTWRSDVERAFLPARLELWVGGRSLLRQTNASVVFRQLDLVWQMTPFNPNNPLSSEILEEEARGLFDTAQSGGRFGLPPGTRQPL